ncbi:hypothetical protein PCASD_24697, partial [Puccinia coronata f. sp. avenae]
MPQPLARLSRRLWAAQPCIRLMYIHYHIGSAWVMSVPLVHLLPPKIPFLQLTILISHGRPPTNRPTLDQHFLRIPKHLLRLFSHLLPVLSPEAPLHLHSHLLGVARRPPPLDIPRICLLPVLSPEPALRPPSHLLGVARRPPPACHPPKQFSSGSVPQSPFQPLCGIRRLTCLPIGSKSDSEKYIPLGTTTAPPAPSPATTPSNICASPRGTPVSNRPAASGKVPPWRTLTWEPITPPETTADIESEEEEHSSSHSLSTYPTQSAKAESPSALNSQSPPYVIKEVLHVIDSFNCRIAFLEGSHAPHRGWSEHIDQLHDSYIESLRAFVTDGTRKLKEAEATNQSQTLGSTNGSPAHGAVPLSQSAINKAFASLRSNKLLHYAVAIHLSPTKITRDQVADLCPNLAQASRDAFCNPIGKLELFFISAPLLSPTDFLSRFTELKDPEGQLDENVPAPSSAVVKKPSLKRPQDLASSAPMLDCKTKKLKLDPVHGISALPQDEVAVESVGLTRKNAANLADESPPPPLETIEISDAPRDCAHPGTPEEGSPQLHSPNSSTQAGDRSPLLPASLPPRTPPRIGSRSGSLLPKTPQPAGSHIPSLLSPNRPPPGISPPDGSRSMSLPPKILPPKATPSAGSRFASQLPKTPPPAGSRIASPIPPKSLPPKTHPAAASRSTTQPPHSPKTPPRAGPRSGSQPPKTPPPAGSRSASLLPLKIPPPKTSQPAGSRSASLPPNKLPPAGSRFASQPPKTPLPAGHHIASLLSSKSKIALPLGSHSPLTDSGTANHHSNSPPKSPPPANDRTTPPPDSSHPSNEAADSPTPEPASRNKPPPSVPVASPRRLRDRTARNQQIAVVIPTASPQLRRVNSSRSRNANTGPTLYPEDYTTPEPTPSPPPPYQEVAVKPPAARPDWRDELFTRPSARPLVTSGPARLDTAPNATTQGNTALLNGTSAGSMALGGTYETNK